MGSPVQSPVKFRTVSLQEEEVKVVWQLPTEISIETLSKS